MNLQRAAVNSYADALRVVFICQAALNVICFLCCIPIQENTLPYVTSVYKLLYVIGLTTIYPLYQRYTRRARRSLPQKSKLRSEFQLRRHSLKSYDYFNDVALAVDHVVGTYIILAQNRLYIICNSIIIFIHMAGRS